MILVSGCVRKSSIFTYGKDPCWTDLRCCFCMTTGHCEMYCAELKTFAETKHSNVLDQIEQVGSLTDEVKAGIEKILKEFSETFTTKG